MLPWWPSGSDGQCVAVATSSQGRRYCFAKLGAESASHCQRLKSKLPTFIAYLKHVIEVQQAHQQTMVLHGKRSLKFVCFVPFLPGVGPGDIILISQELQHNRAQKGNVFVMFVRMFRLTRRSVTI